MESPALNKNKTILICTGIYPPDIGGPATYVENLSRRLSGRDFFLKILSYGEKSSNEILRISRCQNLFFRYVNFFSAAWRHGKDAEIIYAFDLINSGLPAGLAAKFLGKKAILRVGGDFLWEKAYNNGWTNWPLKKYYFAQPKKIKEKLLILLAKVSLSLFDKIIFTTAWQRDVYLEFYRLKRERTAIISNPFPDITPLKIQNDGEGKVFLFAGRLIRLKNLNSLIRAAMDIEGIELKIIGDGPQKEELLGKAENGKVHVNDKMNQKDLFEEIKKSYALIVPSITEISPNLVLECIKLNKPVLVTKESGLTDCYKDKLIFIDPFDIEDIKEKMVYLLNKDNYDSYKDKMKSIDACRGWKEVADDHELLFAALDKNNNLKTA